MEPLLVGERLEALLASLPERPGVYLMKGTLGAVLYVGKAKNLRERVRSYFRASGDTRPFVSWLDRVLVALEVIVAPSEKEALILERELILRHHPRYNVDLRDDKNFLSIRIDTRHRVPRLVLDRRRPRAEGPPGGGIWFGPYASAAAARQTYRAAQQAFGLRTCSEPVFAGRRRPCLQHQMGRCLGPCSLPVGEEQYRSRVRATIQFLRGHSAELVAELQTRMQRAAAAEHFEEAAAIRDRLRAIEAAVRHRPTVEPGGEDVDALGLVREGTSGLVALLQIRDGRWIGALKVPLDGQGGASSDLVRQVIGQHYASGADVPDRLLLPPEVLEDGEGDERHVLAEWLTELAGRRVEVLAPVRGRRLALLALARDNAREALRARLVTTDLQFDRLRRLQRRLALRRLPRRIECFDLSTLGGRLSVGSMAVLVDGQPRPDAYRRFRIRHAPADSDVAMMSEVVGRRLRRVVSGEEPAPDLLLLDGGKGQLRTIEVLRAELGLTDLDLAALAKGPAGAGHHQVSRERVFLPGRKNPIGLRPDSDELFLLSRVRDEAHRFALAYHRRLRRKTALRSVLDEVPGIGPVLRRRLLSHFGSLRAMRGASAEQLASAPGVSRALAERLRDFLDHLNT